MSENKEKKILIAVEIVDNFIAAKKNLDNAKAMFKALQESVSKIDEELRNLTLSENKNEAAIAATTKKLENQKAALNDQATVLAKSNVEFRNAKIEIESASKANDIMTAASDKTVKSLGAMQRELRVLRNTPLDAGDPQKIREVELAMAELTAQIGDYRTRIQGLDTDKTLANIAEGAEMVTATTQALAQGLNLFGVESETFDKLQESTVELIGATQALGVVSEYLADKKYLVVIANIAELNAKLKNTIASWLSVTATTAEAAAEGTATVARTGGTISTGEFRNSSLANNPPL